MFLTRMGFGSKIVITGDVTQIDLPGDKVSGLKEAMRILRDVEDIAICRLSQGDVVRHVIVQRIIKAYEDDETEERRNAEMNTHDIYIDWEFPGANPYKPLLTRVIAAALEAEEVKIPCGVDVLLTDDEGIREINREQREVDSVTDVLSFPMLNLTPGTPPDGTGRRSTTRKPACATWGTWSLT